MDTLISVFRMQIAVCLNSMQGIEKSTATEALVMIK